MAEAIVNAIPTPNTAHDPIREAAEAIYRQLEHLDPTTRYKIVDAIDELAQEEIALRRGDKKNVA